MNNRYGLAPMTFEEEANAPATVKTKREVKVTVADRCALMRQLVDTIENRARLIPETDDEDHAKLVRGFGDAVLFAMLALEDAATLNRERLNSSAFDRQIYMRVQREYDIEDVRSIAEDLEIELTDDDVSEIVGMFRRKHDWTVSDYDQLENLIIQFDRR